MTFACQRNGNDCAATFISPSNNLHCLLNYRTVNWDNKLCSYSTVFAQKVNLKQCEALWSKCVGCTIEHQFKNCSSQATKRQNGWKGSDFQQCLCRRAHAHTHPSLLCVSVTEQSEQPQGQMAKATSLFRPLPHLIEKLHTPRAHLHITYVYAFAHNLINLTQILPESIHCTLCVSLAADVL